MTLLRLLAEHGPLGNAEIRQHLDLKDRAHVRDHYISPALEQGLVELTIPDKPRSSQQKYRLTAAGEAVLASEGEP